MEAAAVGVFAGRSVSSPYVVDATVLVFSMVLHFA